MEVLCHQIAITHKRRYPVGVTLIQTLFSKILGSRPQGTWMGVMLAAGSMSRIIGPVIIVSGYTNFGTTWTFAVTTAFMTIPMAWLYIVRNRLDTTNKMPSNEQKMSAIS